MPVFFDLKIIKEEARGEKMVLGPEGLLVLDAANQTVYQVGTEDKKSEILLGGDSIRGATDLTLGEESFFVLASQGIVEKWGSI